MFNFKNVGSGILNFATKNSATILTTFGCVGVVTTTIFGIGATLAATSIMENRQNGSDFTKKEVIAATWKCYIPTIISGAISIGCIIGANKINTTRNAALAALYSVSETALREYQSKVIENIGAQKEIRIRDGIAKDRVDALSITDGTVIITGKGNVLCLDMYTGRPFRSDIEKIRQAVNELNYDLLSEMWISLNEFYYAIGLPAVKLGDMMGFDINKGKIALTYSAQLTEDGEPCLVLDYTVYPRYDD